MKTSAVSAHIKALQDESPVSKQLKLLKQTNVSGSGSGTTLSKKPKLLEEFSGARKTSDTKLRNLSLDFWGKRIAMIYAVHAPQKLDNIPVLLERYNGKEQKLYEDICAKYNVDPNELELWYE